MFSSPFFSPRGFKEGAVAGTWNQISVKIRVSGCVHQPSPVHHRDTQREKCSEVILMVTSYRNQCHVNWSVKCIVDHVIASMSVVEWSVLTFTSTADLGSHQQHSLQTYWIFWTNVTWFVKSIITSHQILSGASVEQVIELLHVCSGDMCSIPAMAGFVGMNVRWTDDCE